MANTARISQSAVEALASQNSSAQIIQDAIEFVTGAGIACNNPPDGQVGIPYSHTFSFGGGTPPYVFAITGGALPPGLTLNTATGVVSGTPTTLGNYTFTVSITDLVLTTSTVTCSISIVATQSIMIQLIGWKLYPQDPCPDPEELMELPHVDRAV